MLLQRRCHFARRLHVGSDDFGIRANLNDREDATNLSGYRAPDRRDEQDQ